MFNEMLMRDFGFQIYKMLFHAPPIKEEEKKEKKDEKDEKKDDKKDEKKDEKKEKSADKVCKWPDNTYKRYHAAYGKM